MSKKLYRILSCALMGCLVSGALFAGGNLNARAASSKSWNFKDTGFKELGEISSTVTADGLTLIATPEKKMEVKPQTVTVDGTVYTYMLALMGGGSREARAVKVPVSGEDVIKVTLKSSGSSIRKLLVADASGSKLGEMPAGTEASTETFSYSGKAGYLYLYSAGSGINLYKIQVDSKEEAGSGSESDSGSETGNQVIVKNGGISLKEAVSSAGKGTTIVIDGMVSSSAVELPAGVHLKGRNNGTIDFSQTSGSSGRGITISGDGSTLEALTVKNASDNGIYVTGKNNTFKNVTTCYNGDSGIQVSNGGAYNKFYSCYSHHNADSKGENADGFAVKLHSGEGNYFENCRSEYNSDDGWDLYAAHGAVKFVGCRANYNGYCSGIYGDGNGFKLGGVDNKTEGVAAHLDPLNHVLVNCSAKGNYKNGFDRNNQSGVVTMQNCTADSNQNKNYNWPATGKPSALGYEVTFGTAVIQDCISINGSNNIKGAVLKGNCVGF